MSKHRRGLCDGRDTRWLLAGLVFIALPILGANGAPAGAQLSTLNSAIYARAGVHFTNALFYKPSERDAEQLAFKLAPLLIQEARYLQPKSSHAPETIAPAGTLKGFPRVGALVAEGARVKLDFSRATIYFHTDSIRIKEKTHARFAYFWCSGDEHKSLYRVQVQGVRFTLDSSGRPAIWEILHDPSGLDLFFVAESVETAARTQFGPALPGRKYAVERSPAEAAKSVVARVIDDGPMPMGPILYLAGDAHQIATLICRCMPAQATRLLETLAYELINADLEPARTWLAQAMTTASQPAFRFEEADPPGELEKRLRIAGGF